MGRYNEDKLIRFLGLGLSRGVKTAKSRCLGNYEAYYPLPYFISSFSKTTHGDSQRISKTPDPYKRARTQDGPHKALAAR